MVWNLYKYENNKKEIIQLFSAKIQRLIKKLRLLSERFSGEIRTFIQTYYSIFFTAETFLQVLLKLYL